MASLFQGPFFDYLMSQPPLESAEYFKHGSSTMLFTVDERLYRLTRQGCGHNFITRQSILGNPHVPLVIEDFGPVAPSDEDAEDFYWLAEVEWLKDLDATETQTQELSGILAELTDNESLLCGNDLEYFAFRCSDLAKERADLQGVLMTLVTMAAFASAHQAMADIKLDNIMLRAGSGELVVADPICDTYFEIDDVQRERMDQIKARLLLLDVGHARTPYQTAR